METHGTRNTRFVKMIGTLSVIVWVALMLPDVATAHPGTGIVVDRTGQVYFVDMVSGVWKLDTRGILTQLPGPAFHWMALDADGRFSAIQLPSGSAGDIARLGTLPTLLLASDFPIAIGGDGALYYPSKRGGAPIQIVKLAPSGVTSRVATLPLKTEAGLLRDLNGLATGFDGATYYTENEAIRRIGRDGRSSTVVDKIRIAGCAKNALLRGLDVDARGMIYVAATGCGSVLKVTPAGIVTVVVHLSGTWAPTGIALSGENIYVLEFEHPETDDRREMLPRLRKITPDGRSTILATVTRH